MHLHVHHISLEEEAKYVARTRVGACGVMGRGVYIGARHGGLRLWVSYRIELLHRPWEGTTLLLWSTRTALSLKH